MTLRKGVSSKVAILLFCSLLQKIRLFENKIVLKIPYKGMWLKLNSNIREFAICKSPIIHLVYRPKLCIALSLISPGITVAVREIKDNAYAKFWRAKKLFYGRCANGEWPIFEMIRASLSQHGLGHNYSWDLLVNANLSFVLKDANQDLPLKRG